MSIGANGATAWTKQKNDWVYLLWTAYLHLASNGTIDAQKWSEKSAQDFREAAELGQLFAIVETLKVLAEREANAAGLNLPTAALVETSAQHVRYGIALDAKDRDRLSRITTELYAIVMRLDARQKQRGPGGSKIPKTHKSMMMELDGTDRTWQQIADAVNKDYGTDYSSEAVRKQVKRKD